MNLNLHAGDDDPIQCLCNAVEPDSYVRPHRHAMDRWEFVFVLTGAAVVMLFDDAGRVTERLEMREGGDVYGAELPGGIWHTLAALESGTVIFEFKPGPYIRAADKMFAAWAPAEDTSACSAWVRWFRCAAVGERFSPIHEPYRVT